MASKIHNMKPGCIIRWMCVWLILTISCAFSLDDFNFVYLNSHKFCGHDKTWPVNMNLMYKVRSDVSPKTDTSSFMECELTFHSEDADGRLCVIQESFLTQMRDPNVRLVAKDGVGNPDDRVIFDIGYSAGEYHPGIWEKGEACTKSRYLHIFVRKVNSKQPADIRKVFAFLKVVDIRSPHRRLYMGRRFCGENFVLSESSVTVYNRRKPIQGNVMGHEPYNLSPQCGLGIHKEPATQNRSICMVYIPQGEPDCSSEWTLQISSKEYSTSEEDQVYKLTCEDPRASQMHGWCAPASMHYVMLIYLRDEHIWSNKMSPERPHMFRLILRDFPGGDVGELLRTVRSQLPHKGGYTGLAGFSMWWVAAAVAVGLVLFVIVALVYRSRHSMCGGRGRGSRRTSDAGSKSLPAEDENGHAETVSLNA